MIVIKPISFLLFTGLLISSCGQSLTAQAGYVPVFPVHEPYGRGIGAMPGRLGSRPEFSGMGWPWVLVGP